MRRFISRLLVASAVSSALLIGVDGVALAATPSRFN